MHKKYLSDIITLEEVRNWDKGQIYSISAPTSSGKTTFAFNTLFKIAKEREKKILIFSNRKILEAQFFKQISGKEEYIDIVMYQKLEHFKEISEYTLGLFDYSFGDYSEILDFRNYEFIIFDEAHSIFTDYFDTYRENILDIMFKRILGIYVLLSATIEICYSYFQIPDENKYYFEKDYSYIDKVYYYNKKNLVRIVESIPIDEKILIFVNNAEHGRDLKKLLSDAEFICGKSRKNIYRKKWRIQ